MEEQEQVVARALSGSKAGSTKRSGSDLNSFCFTIRGRPTATLGPQPLLPSSTAFEAHLHRARRTRQAFDHVSIHQGGFALVTCQQQQEVS